MSTQVSAAPIKQSIVVEAPIERAFKVFTEDFGSFKPREHNLLSVPIAETVFEPRVGGHVYDRGVDGSECRWARVLAFEPPTRVLLSWDISRAGKSRPIPTRPVNGRCGSSPRRQAGLGWSLNTATSNVMAKVGKASAKALRAIRVGHSI
jgi:uncharacterized protein YndB with AHSA1/START domain